MPLIKRSVEPISVSRSTQVASGAVSVHDDLEYVSVSTLSNVMRQLSSLSVRVDDMFGELNRESVAISRRMIALTERTERLRLKIMQLNPTVEPVLLQDINTRKPFKSSVIKDQQVISLATRPLAVSETYHQCEPPPPLQKLNPYRQDGKDSLKFYTEPGYFFELWCQAMQKDAARNHQKRQRKTRRTPYPSQAAEDDEARRGQQKTDTRISSLDNHTNVIAVKPAGSHNTVDGLIHVQSSAVNGLPMSRPSSLELQGSTAVAVAVPGSGAEQVQNGLVQVAALSSGVHITSACNSITSDSTPVPTRTATSSKSEVKAAAAASKEPQSAVVNDGCTVSPDGVSSRPTPATSAVQLPSPPPTPPNAKPRLVDTKPLMLPSPARSSKTDRDARKHSTPDSVDLPPPPSPPLQFCQSSLDSPGGVLPPPPLDDSLYTIPPCVSPPPPRSPVSSAAIDFITPTSSASKTVAGSNDVSTFVAEQPTVTHVDGDCGVSNETESGVEGEGEDSGVSGGDLHPVRDTRSDLLAAIREGIQLRKVEERRLKSAQKHRAPTHLDVQSLMEAAFELRRKALEDNDSDFDEAGDEQDDFSADWSDVD